MAAVERGRSTRVGGSAEGAEPFADALAAFVADEKDRLRRELTGGSAAAGGAPPELASALASALAALRFEVAELRGRMESLQASVDAVAARLRERDPAGEEG